MTSECKTEGRIAREMQINFYVVQPVVSKIESHVREEETGVDADTGG